MVAPLWGPAYPTGSGIFAHELSQRFAEAGNEVDVFTSTIGNFNGHKYSKNLRLRPLKTYGMVWDMNPIANVFTNLIKEDFDIVHVHSYIFAMSNMAAAARIFNRFGYVLHIHGGIDHGDKPVSSSFRMMMKDKIYDRTLGSLTVKMADRVLSVSKKDVNLIESKFNVNAEHIPNAVRTDKFTVADNASHVVTYVGKLEKWKGTEDLIKIFKLVSKEVKDAKFVVAGNGSLSNEVKNADVPIEMIGHVPHDLMPQLYHSTAVSVLPSHMEGSPTTCIEALSCGVPCVATNVGDTSQIVNDGKSGFLVEPGSIREFADRIIELLENDKLRRDMGRTGREHIVDNFSYDSVVNRIGDIYRAVAR
jgi:glycosyltransferase involved in cell wall biosynthesis